VKAIAKRAIKPLVVRTVRALANIILDEIEEKREEKRSTRAQRLLSQLQSCGAGVEIEGRIHLSDPWSVALGNNVHIGDNAYLSSAGGLTIGDNTHIAPNVTIYTVERNTLGQVLPYDSIEVPRPVAIGRNVWIDRDVSIAPGVHIGDGAIIGMGTVVTGDVPPLAVVGSPPVCILQHRDRDHYARLEQRRRYGGANGTPLSQEEVTRFGLRGQDPDVQLFFVVTTGRSGSMTIAHILSQHPEITCRHEPRRQLIRLSTEFAYGAKTREQVQDELRAIYCNSGVFFDRVCGESDQKFWNLIPMLSELLPFSKFIWLIRDGRNVVASAHGRGWFDPQESEQGNPTSPNVLERWMYYRLNGARCGRLDEGEWESLSAFERNCWYWSHVNSQIESQLTALPDDRWLTIRLEGLDHKTDAIFEFLGVDPVPVPMARLNVAHYPVERWENWDGSERSAFERWCGDGMDRWYPGWRDGKGPVLLPHQGRETEGM